MPTRSRIAWWAVVVLVVCAANAPVSADEYPTVDFTWSPASPKVGEPVTFTATSSPGAMVRWEWRIREDNPSIEAYTTLEEPIITEYTGTHPEGRVITHTFTYANDGNQLVRLVGIDNLGRRIIDNDSVPVRGTSPTASFSFSPDEPASGEEISFSGHASDPDSDAIVLWRWTIEGATLDGQEVAWTYSGGGCKEVRLLVVDATGMWDNEIESCVLVGEPIPVPTAHFTVSPESPCVAETVHFDASGSTGVIDSYEWDLGDGTHKSGVRVAHVYDSVSSHQVRLEIRNDAGGTDTETRHMSVEDCTYTLTVSKPSEDCGSASVTPDKDRYDRGETVSLRADPCNDWKFDYWSWAGDGVDYSRYTTVVMTGDKSVTAHFFHAPPPKHTLTTSTSGCGAIRLTQDKNEYDDGEVVRLGAEPCVGSQFASWSGDVPTSQRGRDSVSITMDRNKSVIAHFTAGDPCVNGTGSPSIDDLQVSSECTLDGNRVTLSWFASDDCTGRESIEYRYRLGSQPWSSWDLENSIELVLVPDRYVLQVEARDEAGNTTRRIRTFEIDSCNPCLGNQPPNALSKRRPENGSIAGLRPNFYWEGSDPNKGDTHTYDLYLTTSPVALLTPEATASAQPTASLTEQLNWAPQEDLFPGAIYYWRIVMRDQCGAESLSDLWSFTTDTPTPDLSEIGMLDLLASYYLAMGHYCPSQTTLHKFLGLKAQQLGEGKLAFTLIQADLVAVSILAAFAHPGHALEAMKAACLIVEAGQAHDEYIVEQHELQQAIDDGSIPNLQGHTCYLTDPRVDFPNPVELILLPELRDCPGNPIAGTIAEIAVRYASDLLQAIEDVGDAARMMVLGLFGMTGHGSVFIPESARNNWEAGAIELSRRLHAEADRIKALIGCGQ